MPDATREAVRIGRCAHALASLSKAINVGSRLFISGN